MSKKEIIQSLLVIRELVDWDKEPDDVLLSIDFLIRDLKKEDLNND